MVIYPQEQIDGLSDLLKSSSEAFSIDIKVVDQGVEIDEFLRSLGQANPNQFDLFYLESILASVGWNTNDDVFDKNEIWAARNTPIDKPFNCGHKDTDIIGHITSTRVVADGQLIENNENLPDQFDVIVGSVLYRRWATKALQERMDQLIEEIKAGDWFVSMECLFKNFDYALITPDGQHRVVARNENTAFLTKHLRRYKGSGEFQGNKIGRLLRGFAFSGEGLVRNPANKRSVILNFSDVSDVESEFQTTASEENIMAVTYTEEQYKELEIKLVEAERSAKEAADKVVAKELNELKAQVSTLETQNAALIESTKTLEDQRSVSEAVQDENKSKIESLEKENAELKTKVDEQAKALAEIEKEKVRAGRLEKLSATDITVEKAQALVDKFADVSNEMFDELVSSLPVKAQANVDPPADPPVDPPATPDVPAEASLDSLELDDGLALSVANTDEAVELRAAASQWFRSMIPNSKVKE